MEQEKAKISLARLGLARPARMMPTRLPMTHQQTGLRFPGPRRLSGPISPHRAAQSPHFHDSPDPPPGPTPEGSLYAQRPHNTS